MIPRTGRARQVMIVVLVTLSLTRLPDAHAQRVAIDVSTADRGSFPTPDEIAAHVRAVPTPNAIIDRILSVNQNAPHIASMDFVASMRVRRPASAPPDCVFEGAVKFQGEHRSATVNHLTPGVLCVALNRTIVSRLFEGNEPFAALLARFDFQVLGEKTVDGDQYYLVQGKARESQVDPRVMIGWIDYNRGLVSEATMQYAAAAIDLVQDYTSITGAWVLSHQYVNIPSLGSTLEISYSKVTLKSARAFRASLETHQLYLCSGASRRSGKFCAPSTSFFSQISVSPPIQNRSE
jgi:hypothetical protein